MIPHINKVDLHTERRDLCAQIPHVGSNDDEAPTTARVHGEFLPENGLAENGLHHEICLSGPTGPMPHN